MRGGAKAWSIPLLVLAGCPDPGNYACLDDTDCDREGQFGQCLSDRACAYPVPTDRCPSGLIRSPNAATDPGACVPDDDAESSSTQTDSAQTSGGCDDPLGVEVALELDALADAGAGYPLLLQLTDDGVAEALRAHAQALVVTSADGTPLPAQWDLGEGGDPVHAWIRLPDPAVQDAATLQVRWDGAAPDPTDVWSDYAFVWHFDEASNTDATRTGASGDLQGAPLPAQSTPAVIGNGLAFDGLDDALWVTPAPAREDGPFTVSVWARYDDPSGERAEYFSSLGGDTLYPRCFRNGEGNAVCQIRQGTQSENLSGSSHPPGVFQHIALVRDGDAVQLYIDGQPEGSASATDGTVGSGRDPWRIADGQWGPAMITLDELRYADRAIPASWIAFDAQTQQDPSAVVTSAALRCD